MSIITVNPVTRISGFLQITAEVENNKIINARSSGLLFRGFEKMLQGRAPLDAIYFTERICGICSTAHAAASSLALEDALKLNPDMPAKLMREFIHGCEFLQNHLRHFYQYTMPDYVKGPDINPLYIVNHQDFRLPKYLNDLLASHYVQSLEYSRLSHELLAVLGGKAPHNHGIFAGGITSDIDIAKFTKLRSLLLEIKAFIDGVMLEDCYTLGQYYPEYYSLGAGPGNLMTYGVFNYPEYGDIYYTGPGTYIGEQLQPLNTQLINEDIQKSWYTAESNINYPEGPYTEEAPYKEGAYSWDKAPRYQGLPMEVGPLARMVISGGYNRGISAMDRTVARVLEVQKITGILLSILQLIPEYHNQQREIPIPDEAAGMGLIDTTRGALGHWIAVKDKVIRNYNIITPSAWNLSPEDFAGTKGPVESALIGTVIQNINAPVEIGRIVRSFDPCVSCATHVYGKDTVSTELRLM